MKSNSQYVVAERIVEIKGLLDTLRDSLKRDDGYISVVHEDVREKVLRHLEEIDGLVIPPEYQNEE